MYFLSHHYQQFFSTFINKRFHLWFQCSNHFLILLHHSFIVLSSGFSVWQTDEFADGSSIKVGGKAVLNNGLAEHGSDAGTVKLWLTAEFLDDDVYFSRLYKSPESGNETKISDKKWRSAKTKYIKNKKWEKSTVKSTSIMSSDCNDVSCFQQISKKKYNLPLKFGYFHFCMSSSTFLTASWLAIFVSAESSRTALSTDRSEPRYESHTGGKMKAYSLPSIWLESWSHTIKGMIELNSEKNKNDLYHVR